MLMNVLNILIILAELCLALIAAFALVVSIGSIWFESEEFDYED